MLDDLALASIVALIAAMPISLAVLLLTDVVRLDGEGQKRLWIRRALTVAALPLIPWFGISAWGWAGAAHLEPLCFAYGDPDIRNTYPIPRSQLQLEVTRLTHHRNTWFDVSLERYQVIDLRYGTTVAEADEVELVAGRAKYRCGLISGPRAVRDTGEINTQPAIDALLQQVAAGRRPKP
jgi:hypothetical protein